MCYSPVVVVQTRFVVSALSEEATVKSNAAESQPKMNIQMKVQPTFVNIINTTLFSVK